MARGAPLHKLVHTEVALHESAPVLMIRVQELNEWAEAVHDPSCVEELHNMRIAAKRLRYTLELFTPVLGKDANKLLKIVENIQEQLGAIHDCDVLFPLLVETMEKESRRERHEGRGLQAGPTPYLAVEGLSALLARKRDERNQRYNNFVKFWDSLPPYELTSRFARLVGVQTDDNPLTGDIDERSASTATSDEETTNKAPDNVEPATSPQSNPPAEPETAPDEETYAPG